MAGLSRQLATLSSSLATISAEKSKMESSFQADKKQLLVSVTSLPAKMEGAVLCLHLCLLSGFILPELDL